MVVVRSNGSCTCAGKLGDELYTNLELNSGMETHLRELLGGLIAMYTSEIVSLVSDLVGCLE